MRELARRGHRARARSLHSKVLDNKERIADLRAHETEPNARKLEEAEYVSCTKSFQDRVPHTDYRITLKGRRALEDYLGHMEALIKAVRDG